jgi:putative ABC transport system permease protein
VWTFASPAKFGTREQLVSYYVRAREELAAVPSVVSVGEGSAGPLFGGDGEGSFTLDGQPAGSGAPRQAALWYDIDPHYFRTLGVPIVRGRDIDATDVVGAPLAAVVNETFARRYLGDRDPLGHIVHMNEHDTSFTIVGVVKDVPPLRVDADVPPQIFWSNRQIPRPATYFLVRTAGDPANVGRLVRDRLQALDPDLQVGTVRTMREWLARTLVRPRFATVLVATFGVLALALAAIGTYGLLAYDVTRQRREIGIRIALGAAPRTIVAAVLGRGMRLAVLATMLGVAGAIALTGLLRGELSGVSPTDPVTFAVSALVLLAIAAIACVLPAWRASDVDPLETLRTE